MKRIRSGAGKRGQQPRIGAPDPALTPNAGLAAITELCGRLGGIGALDAAADPIKQRDRGFGAGELLAGLAAAQLAGEDFLTGPTAASSAPITPSRPHSSVITARPAFGVSAGSGAPIRGCCRDLPAPLRILFTR